MNKRIANIDNIYKEAFRYEMEKALKHRPMGYEMTQGEKDYINKVMDKVDLHKHCDFNEYIMLAIQNIMSQASSRYSDK